MNSNPPEEVLVVTGGGAGIGRATVAEWREQGGRVAALDLRFDEDVTDGVLKVDCDVTDRASVASAIGTVRRELGRIDCLVNAAGIMRVAPSATVTEDDAQAVMSVNWLGSMLVSQEVRTDLAASSGSIVNISSVAGISGMPNRVAYNSSKAAIDALTRTLAVEWASEGIRVNAVAPGYTFTRMTGELIATNKLWVEPITARTPLGRFAEPREIAQPISFLLSKAASYITGQTLYVDGGMTIDGNWY